MSIAESLDLAELDAEDYRCARCGCCEMERATCCQCGGAGGFNRYEDSPLEFAEDDWLQCDWCKGTGFVRYCDGCCDPESDAKHGCK